MVMDRTTLGRAIRRWSATSCWRSGQATMAAPAAYVSRLQAPQRLKAATAKWREAQKEFETAFGAHDAAELRTVLRRAISATSKSAVQ